MLYIAYLLLPVLLSAAPQPIAPKSIRTVDFRNFSYRWYPSGYRSPTRSRSVTLVGGALEVRGSGKVEDVFFDLSNVSYVDLTGDGIEDALVTVTAIFNPNGGCSCTFIFSMVGSAPVERWRLETGNRAFGGLRSLAVSNGALIVEHYDTRFDDVPSPCMICPSRVVRTTYRWKKGRIRTIGTETRPFEGVGVPFLGYPGDSRQG
jgi:hypothetical protein